MEQPVNLYIELVPDGRADLEVIARASLAFVAAIKDAASLLDPFCEIRVEIVNGQEGSLNINALIKSITGGKKIETITLKAILLVVASWFVRETATYIFGKSIDEVVGYGGISNDEISKIALEVERVREGKSGKEHIAEAYRELAKDEAVVGVGISDKHGQKPKLIVPRSQFHEFWEFPEALQPQGPKRVRTPIQWVTLVSPVLLDGERRWRFSSQEGEFGAPMMDEGFRRDVLDGKVPLMAGIEIEVLLEIKEEMEHGVWVVKERSILRVINTRKPPSQEGLYPSSMTKE